MALVLLAASGLLLRSFEKMRDVNLGFQPDHTVVAGYLLPRQQYGTQAAVDQFNQQLLRRLNRLAGVRSAGLTSFLPASGNNSNGAFVAEGHVPAKGEKLDLATPISVQGNYFQAMGIPLLRGRVFTPDDVAGRQLVVTVDQKLAEQSWPGKNPVGKRLHMGTPATRMPWATVVGEVQGIKEGSPDQPTKQQWYGPIDQQEELAGSLASPDDLYGDGGYIVLRSVLPPAQMENALRATAHSIDAQLPLTQVQTMERAVSDTEAPRRFDTVLISSFAGAAVLLALLDPRISD